MASATSPGRCSLKIMNVICPDAMICSFSVAFRDESRALRSAISRDGENEKRREGMFKLTIAGISQ